MKDIDNVVDLMETSMNGECVEFKPKKAATNITTPEDVANEAEREEYKEGKSIICFCNDVDLCNRSKVLMQSHYIVISFITFLFYM